MPELDCPRDCGESFTGPNGLADLRKEKHLATEHDAPWEEIENWPRAPSKR